MHRQAAAPDDKSSNATFEGGKETQPGGSFGHSTTRHHQREIERQRCVL